MASSKVFTMSLRWLLWLLMMYLAILCARGENHSLFWLKPLIMQGNGCTAFNEDGEIVYRMDNYGTRPSRKVHLMDLRDRFIFTIIKRRLRVFRCCLGSSATDLHGERIWFHVRKDCCILTRSLLCKVAVFCGKTQRSCYTIEGFTSKSEFDINNGTEAIIAEVKRKQTTSGVYLGDDVLALVVEPQVDRSLIVALVAVHSSICHRM